MTTPARFDRRHAKGAFLRLCTMLADPTFASQQIGDEFGLTRQRIFALAKQLGVDGKQRRHDRAFQVRPHVIGRFKKYPPAIQAVMDKLRRTGCMWLPITYHNQVDPNALRLR